MTDPRSGSPPIRVATDKTAVASNDGSSAAPATQLDRSALERVLARAAELQAGQAEPAEQMSEAQLIEVGQEVGISAEHVRLALAEERTRVQLPEARGMMGALFGGEGVSASRLVRGTATDLLGRIDDWMQREEGLRPKRRFTDRLTWESRRDFLSSIQTGFNFSGRAYALTPADEVAASVVQVDAERCIVRLDASLTQSRRNHVIGGSVAVGGGMLGLGGVMALATLIPDGSILFGALVGAVPALTGSGIGYAVGAAQRRKLHRAQLALEQILDRLERGEIRRPVNPLANFLDVVTRTVDSMR